MIGIQLGIPLNKLQEFKKEDDPLSLVVDYWLKGNATEPVSWESIVIALKSEHVEETRLARQIIMDHCEQEDTKDKTG